MYGIGSISAIIPAISYWEPKFCRKAFPHRIQEKNMISHQSSLHQSVGNKLIKERTHEIKIFLAFSILLISFVFRIYFSPFLKALKMTWAKIWLIFSLRFSSAPTADKWACQKIYTRKRKDKNFTQPLNYIFETMAIQAQFTVFVLWLR